MLDLLSGII